MKKIIVFLLAILLCLPSCTGIGDGLPESSEKEDSTQAQTSAQNSREELEYSPVSVSSGGATINPIRAYSYSSYYKDGEGYEADGLGSYDIYSDPSITPNDFPTLVCAGDEVTFSYPSNLTFGRVTVRDLNYVSIPITVELERLAELPVGDYVIEFSETERGDGLTTGYDAIFRLVITQSTSSHPGYFNQITMIRYDFSGYGVSTKVIEPCYLSYTIIDMIVSLSVTETKAEKIADGELEDYGYSPPVERGTLWLEIGSSLYRINPDATEMCLVKTHLGAGYRMSGEYLDLAILAKCLYEAWYYHPYDYYSGTYDNSTGTISLERMYEAESGVEIGVIDFDVKKEYGAVNTVTVEITAKKDADLRLVLDSRQSDDNLGAGDLKELSMKKGERQTLTLSFSGWQYSYWIYIRVDNTVVSVQIKP